MIKHLILLHPFHQDHFDVMGISKPTLYQYIREADKMKLVWWSDYGCD